MTVLGPRLATRSATLEIGTHGAVTISIRNFNCDLKGHIGADISYRGHRDDIVRMRCISADLLDRTPYDQVVESEVGLMVISSRAGKNHRGFIDVSYCIDNLAITEELDGVPTTSDAISVTIVGVLPSRLLNPVFNSDRIALQVSELHVTAIDNSSFE